MFKKIKKTIKNTWLCLKYPFLYTRNRFTGKHYTNWSVQNKIRQLEKKYIVDFSFIIRSEQDCSAEILKNESSDKWETVSSFEDRGYTFHIFKGGKYAKISIKCNDKIIRRHRLKINDVLSQHKLSYKDVEDIYFRTCKATNFMGERIYTNQILFVIKNSAVAKNKYSNFNFLHFPIRSGIKFKIGLLEILERLIAPFHIFPSCTELDAMEKGWRIKFGENMCREIRNSLLLTYVKNEQPTNIFSKIKCYYKGMKLLFSYRILQIKEKYGQCRWYAYYDTKDTLRIISKYENISEHTCIVCGKEATYRSTGWICPYCDEHKPDGSVKIGEERNGDNEY